MFQVGFEHPDWFNGFEDELLVRESFLAPSEREPEDAARVRVALLRELAANRESLVATHLSLPSCLPRGDRRRRVSLGAGAVGVLIAYHSPAATRDHWGGPKGWRHGRSVRAPLFLRPVHEKCKNANVKKYVLWGILIGGLAGIVEAMITAIGAPDYWLRVKIHWGQLGFAGWGLGGVVGYFLALRMERRSVEREARGLCRGCGYDLTGNVSGKCTECGAPIPARTRKCDPVGSADEQQGG
ncbi:MAG: hypothetical protein JNG88_02225 [Phycisphaerales bacterium]|nr:hypothetical protein [Phycisphaerales bacterium]